MRRPKIPKWWNSQNDSAWRRAKRVMRELTQTKILGGQPYKNMEPAYRFGFGARLTLGHRNWDANFEMQLAEDWRALTPARKQKWEDDRAAILDGWNLGAKLSQERGKKATLLQKIEPAGFPAPRFAERLAA